MNSAIALINGVTPGRRGGRPVVALAGKELTAAVTEALTVGMRFDGDGELVDDADAARIADLATKLRAVIEDVDAGRVDDAARRVNDLLIETEARPTLARHDGEPWHLHFHAADAPPPISWVAPMATGLAVMIGNPSIERLGICTAPDCDRAYVDTSRNGTRRFCSTTCQNRVKTAAFRARKAAV
ncbi:CGNR zinc finger domain-containing protein [Pseudonocardia sp. CA-107938]|uniref:CGNR zinc finger domain-containing protein n=1 Tax=Pseudonocardia sp. CA-107938 TaxID=3240021 RepID=UPI003D919F65